MMWLCYASRLWLNNLSCQAFAELHRYIWSSSLGTCLHIAERRVINSTATGKLPMQNPLYAQDYLETKRVAFPRFYFVAAADLLDILAKGSNPQLILRYVLRIPQLVCQASS